MPSAENSRERRIRKEIDEEILKLWQADWDNDERGATTKLFLPNIGKRLKMKLPKDRKKTQILTGHGNINNYLFRIGKEESGECECRSEIDNIKHRLTECPIFDPERTKLMNIINWKNSLDELIVEIIKDKAAVDILKEFIITEKRGLVQDIPEVE
jgi:hypothetical protein